MNTALLNITVDGVKEMIMSKQDSIYFMANPFQIPLWAFPVLLMIKVIAEYVMDVSVFFVLKTLNVPKLPSRYPVQRVKGLEALQTKDYLTLFINSFVELMFIQNLLSLVFVDSSFYGFSIPHNVTALNPLNTIAAIYSIFLIDDFIYYWFHRFMHLRVVYPFIHKHHHRQSMPARGYSDAANESPLEMVGGLFLVWVSMRITSVTIGLHAFTIPIFFVLYALGAILNHTPYDVQFGILGLGYNVRAHETHHRFLTSNYAQNTMVWDKLFGTFTVYRSGTTENEKKVD